MDSQKIWGVILLVIGLTLLIKAVTQWLGWLVITLPPIAYLVLGIGMFIYGLSQTT